MELTYFKIVSGLILKPGSNKKGNVDLNFFLNEN